MTVGTFVQIANIRMSSHTSKHPERLTVETDLARQLAGADDDEQDELDGTRKRWGFLFNVVNIC